MLLDSQLSRIFADKCLTRPGTEKKIPVKIAFMGDSRMRQVYRALERFIKTGLLPGGQLFVKKFEMGLLPQFYFCSIVIKL